MRTASIPTFATWLALALPGLAAAEIWEPKVGEPFPDLRLPTLEDGISRSISDYRGEKILLHVFASW